jgi:hypothetical protein
MKQFNIETETTPVADFKFAGRQSEMAKLTNSVRVFTWRDVRGNVNLLPNYVINAIRAAGYEAHCLGGTTYSHSVIGLSVRTQGTEDAK